MMAAEVEHGRASADWLALREPADALARSTRLLDDLPPLLRPKLLGSVGVARSTDRATPTNPSNNRSRLIVHDLGSGTGSQRRWLAPRLPWPQHWVEHDRDAALQTEPLAPSVPARRSEGRSRDSDDAVEVTRCTCDLAELSADHLKHADLITASALLDVLTATTIDRLAEVAAALRVPTLLTLSVVGRVRLGPSDPLDQAVLAAFNEHQRRGTAAGRLLGPDAVAYATHVLRRRGATVRSASSPWSLGSSTGPQGNHDDRGRALLAAWFTGWLDAALEQQPDLATRAADYRRRRRAEIDGRRLAVTVEHTDLLAWWP